VIRELWYEFATRFVYNTGYVTAFVLAVTW
jgi:hypothetical protein